jgi:hypothetical protein
VIVWPAFSLLPAILRPRVRARKGGGGEKGQALRSTRCRNAGSMRHALRTYFTTENTEKVYSVISVFSVVKYPRKS